LNPTVSAGAVDNGVAELGEKSPTDSPPVILFVHTPLLYPSGVSHTIGVFAELMFPGIFCAFAPNIDTVKIAVKAIKFVVFIYLFNIKFVLYSL
jgi:hypothetical protein